MCCYKDVQDMEQKSNVNAGNLLIEIDTMASKKFAM